MRRGDHSNPHSRTRRDERGSQRQHERRDVMAEAIVHPDRTTAPAAPRHPWTIVLGSAIALAFCAVPILQYTYGLFMKPLEAEFGWNRVELSLGISSVQFISIPSVFAVGWAMDRWGIKRVIGPLILLFAVNVALMAILNSLTMFIALYALF